MSVTRKSTNGTNDTRAYQTVCEILDRIRALHVRMRDQLCLGVNGADERTDLVRRDICKHEERAIVALTDYCSDSDVASLETWIQYVPLEDSLRELAESDLAGPLPVDELISRKARFDAALMEFYRHCSRETSASRAHDIFRQLAEQTEKAMQEQSWRYLDTDI